MNTPDPFDERRFAEFDMNHPEVWEMFQAFAFERIRQGFQRFSSDAILHRIRWETASPKVNGGGYKLNNDLTPFYARKFRETYPKYAAFFETRSARVDRGRKAA